MKVVLVSPPTTVQERYPKGHPLRKTMQVTEPLGLAYIAAMLEPNHEVEIIDCIAEDLPILHTLARIEKRSPEILGISAFTPTVHQAVKLAKLVKQLMPSTTVVLGGIHPTIFPEQVMQNEAVDFVVIGEGEYAMHNLVQAIENQEELSNVHGIVCRRNREIVFNPPHPLEKNLDSLPLPARHLLPMDRYKPFIAKRRPARSMISSRGCPYECVFCSRDISGSRYRLRSVASVIEEIKILVDEYVAKEIDFQDPVFGLNQTWTKEFCQRLTEEKLDVVWSALTRVDLIDENLLRSMRKSGCWMLYYGIEAGDQELLNNIKKNIKLEDIRKSVELTRKLGIGVWGSFMFGLPSETPELAEKTLEFAKNLPLDFASFHFTTPFPSTELWRDFAKWGELRTDFSDFTQLNAVFVPHGWKNKEDELQGMLQRAFKEFYFRPKYVFGQLLKIRSFADLKLYYHGVGSLL